ncbi:MAG: hypothetical protein JJU00_09805 [Opitutales bacterium]|nr:hypothetical protein [Opitutales bacterium]
MKRAFFQALVLFALLGITWFFVALRFCSDDARPVEPPPPVEETLPPVLDDGSPETTEEPPVEEASPTPGPEDADADLPDALQTEVGEAVLAAADALAESPSQAYAAGILRDLRAALAAAPRGEAVAAVTAFLETGRDERTRLPFSVGRGGRLETAPSLRVFLLDELGTLDPAAATQMAETGFEATESADEYAIHLRNFAWGSDLPPVERIAKVRERAMEMTQRNAWREAPTDGFAEAYDALVYATATEVTSQLARDTDRSRPGNIRRPSNLALDRLVIAAPEETLPQILDDMESMRDQPYTRAGYFARSDLRDPVQREIVESYLLSDSVGPDERTYFFDLFPNQNFHHSRNLLSENQYPSHEEIVERLRGAHEQTSQWLEDERFAADADDIARARQRLAEILGETPEP